MIPALALYRYPANAATRRAKAVLLTVLALACPVVPVAGQSYDRGLLWRVERDGAAPSHLFGTVHVDDARVARLPPPVERAFTQSASLAVEVALDLTNVFALANSMVLRDGRDLAAVAGAELFAQAAAIASRKGLPEPLLRPFKPWAAALLIMMPSQNPENVLDHLLVRRAADAGKPVRQLETVAEQVEAFDGMSESDQIDMLRHAVDSHERLPRMTARLIEAWLARDLAGIWRISQEAQSPEERRLNEIVAERVLYARNVRMAERMADEIREGGVFAAVGALHLYGERGVLAELARRGYRVTAIY